MSGPAPPTTANRALGVPWWAWIALGSAALIHGNVSSWLGWLPWPGIHESLSRAESWLALELENNFGAWWSAALIFLGAALWFEVAASDTRGARRPFAILGVLSLGMSLDEVASIHERLSHRWGWSPLLAIGLVCAALLGWALWALGRRHGRWRTVLLVAAGYVCYGSIALQEAAEHGKLGGWSWWHSGRLEEGSELLGSLLVLLAVVGERHRTPEGRLRAVIPRPDRLPRLAGILTAALVAHALVSVFVVPRLPDWEWRGNPATWYPSAVYGLAASAAFWRTQGPRDGRRAAWGPAAALFLVASIGAIFDEVALFPGIERFLPRRAFYGFYAAYAFLVPPLLLVGIGGRLVRRPILLLVALALPLVLHWLTGSWRVDVVTPGFLAWTFALAFQTGEPAAMGGGQELGGARAEGCPRGRLLIIGPSVTEEAGERPLGSRIGELVDDLAPRFAEVVYFGDTGRSDDERVDRTPRLHGCQARNVRVVPGRARPAAGRGRVRAVLAPGAWLPVLRLIRGADFVHIWMPSFPGILTHLLCRLWRRPYSLYFVSDWLEIAPFARHRATLSGWRLRLYRWVAGAAERAAVRRARFTLVEGRSLQRKFAPLHPRVVEAIARLDMRATDVFERDDTCQGRVVTLLHVGSIVPRKAVLLLVDALRILTDRGRSVGLQLVGGGDPSYEAAVRAAVRAHGLDERVEFAGLVTHVPSLLARYRQADIFVMASLGEGFPRVLIEAAAQGLPVVATSIETVAGTMRHEHDALLVPPGSGEALANGVERLMGDGRLRSALIRNGHAFARAHFARGRPSAQLWQLIRDSYPNPAGSAP